MKLVGIEKSRVYVTVDIIDYMANSVVSKTILMKTTGNVTVISFDAGQGKAEKTSPFDTLVQVIEGQAEIIIDGEIVLLAIGESIIIPANTSNRINANVRLKMIQTIIKSGYE